jgi:acyl-CoA thioester hydrolase
MYATPVSVGWADVDLNGHMRNSAYLEKSVDVRMRYFAAAGFDVAGFAQLRVGPVVMNEELRYFKEVGLLAELSGTMALAGLAPDGSRWRLRNEFLRADGTLAARIDSTGGWLDTAARRLIAPPAALGTALEALGRTADFAVLPSSLRAAPGG